MFDYRPILAYLKNRFRILDVILITGLIGLFFAIRLTQIEILPVFNDEGIYIEWTKTAVADPTQRFISHTDGKQPLQTWLSIPLLKLFPDQALFAARLMSVFTGFAAMTGIFALLMYLWNKRTAYIGAILYIITPYFLFYDRLAMIDSGVNAAFIWILFFSILLARTRRLDIALLFGLITGVGLLAKSSVMMFLALAVFGVVLFAHLPKPKKAWKPQLLKQLPDLINFAIVYAVGAALALVISNMQRLSGLYHMVGQKNYTFIARPAELLADPLMNVTSNTWQIPYFILAEMAYLIPLIGVAGLVLLFRSQPRLFWYALLWIGLPYVVISFFNTVLFPRYIIFLATWFLILAAYAIGQLKDRRLIGAAIALVFLSTWYHNYTILFAPEKIPFPQIDRGQYIEGWPAGWGATEIIEYARSQATDTQATAQEPVRILAEGNFGMAADVLRSMTTPADTAIAISGLWPLGRDQLIEAQEKYQDQEVLVVLSHYESVQEVPQDWPIELIKAYDKPGDESQLLLYRLLPADQPAPETDSQS